MQLRVLSRPPSLPPSLLSFLPLFPSFTVEKPDRSFLHQLTKVKIWGNARQIRTEGHSTKWPICNLKGHESEERPRNCFTLMETREMWQLGSMCDPDLGHFAMKGVFGIFGEIWMGFLVRHVGVQDFFILCVQLFFKFEIVSK